MGSSRRLAALSLVLFLAAPGAWAQQNAPRIGYVYPAGGRQGTTFQVTAGGQFLNGVANAYVSGAGVHATFIQLQRQLTPKEQDEPKKKVADFQEKRRQGVRLTAEEDKQFAEVRMKLTQFGRRLSNPALSEFVTLQVTIAPDAEPGQREFRLAAPNGLSNPLVFNVGVLPEYTKEDWKNTPVARFSMDPKTRPSLTETPITPPAAVNGQIQPGGVDRYRFPARAGQKLVIAASARELIPYLADAVPGWFQAALTLYDDQGNELAYDDDNRLHPDPVIFYQIPKDGQYVFEIKDTIYRGREDFVYRISVGELPFVTSIFPLGGKAGAQTTVEMRGWNLPVTQLTQDGKDKGPGVYPFSVRKGEWTSNRVPFALDALPEVLEKKPNGSPENAQAVTLPVIVNGRVDRPGQWHVFRFEGRAGDDIVAEVYARRLGSPLDSVLRLTDAKGRQLAFNDDHEDKGTGLNTHHADSYLRAKLPANGTYYLHLGDIQRQGGPEYAFRLRISAPRPDYELRVTPSSINVRAGGSALLTVYALRRDGFSDGIELALKDPPAGFALSGAYVPALQDQVRLTLTAPTTPLAKPVALRLEGRAKIQGQEVVKTAVPAEDMMQAFAYRHLVPSQELEVVTSGRPARMAMRILSATPVKIPAGGTARVQVGLPTSAPAGTFKLELSEPPEGISLQGVSPIGRGTEIVLRGDAAKVKPSLKGNLIVNVFMLPNNPATAPARPQAGQRRVSLGALPAIPFEIVAKEPRSTSSTAPPS